MHIINFRLADVQASVTKNSAINDWVLNKSDRDKTTIKGGDLTCIT